MEFTTHLELQSQATRLFENRSYAFTLSLDGAITLLGGPFQNTLLSDTADLAYTDYNSED